MLKTIPQQHQYPEGPIFEKRIEPTLPVEVVRQVSQYMNRAVQFIVIRSRLQHDFMEWLRERR